MSTEPLPTVAIVVSRELEPYFRDTLSLFGEGAQIVSTTDADFVFDVRLHVHIPGAPAWAVRAEPTYRTVHIGNGQYRAELESVTWYDAVGNRIEEAA